MKNRKGFTLVELLVVMVILGIITGLSIPLIRNIKTNNEQKQYTTYEESVVYSAKLYVNSYDEDLFGHQKSGCVIIPYSWMEEKGLLKDIQVDNVSCKSSETFVKVVKINDKYGYAASIGCGTKKADGTVQIETKLPETGLSSSDTCSIDATTIMSFSATPNESTSHSYKKRNITIHVKSETGVNNNAKVYYGFSKTKNDNPVIIGAWKELPLNIIGGNEQNKKILAGESITIDSNQIQTVTETGTLYLYLKIETLEDLTGRNWTTDPDEKTIQYIGSYVVDNTKPVFNDSTVVSSESGYNSIKPKLNLKVTDEIAGTNDLKMCISYDSDTCKKTVKEIKGTGYEKYNASKVLDKIVNDYDGSTHTIYVTVADPAGNSETKSFSYEVAFKLTYDMNGISDTLEPTYCNKGVECRLRTNPYERKGYNYLGFYDSATGGNKYGETTILNSNKVAYARWKIKEIRYEDISSAFQCQNKSAGNPEDWVFVYTGACDVVQDGGTNWKVYLYGDQISRSGLHTIKFADELTVDLFVVGGGGATGTNWGGGGGGGYTKQYNKIKVQEGTIYNVQIGAGGNAEEGCSKKSTSRCQQGSAATGGTTYAFSTSYSAAGGTGGNCGNPGAYFGSGGGTCVRGVEDSVFGGNGGSGGGNGWTNYYCTGMYSGATLGNSRGGSGQGYSTCEFNVTSAKGTCPSGIKYSAGGRGSCIYNYPIWTNYVVGGNGAANTGNGANADPFGKYSGGSGIAVFRNTR